MGDYTAFLYGPGRLAALDKPPSNGGTAASLAAGFGTDYAVEVLRIAAWLNLVGGVVMALIFWMAKMGVLGGGIGVGLLLEGIIGCALLLVLCGMAENLIAIRRAVERPAPRTEV